MKFCDLDNGNQNFLIDQLNCYIDRKAEEEGIDSYEYPTFEEYKTFFDDYDVDYEIDDGYPISTEEDEYHPKFRIDFKDNKVVLNTYAFDYDGDN